MGWILALGSLLAFSGPAAAQQVGGGFRMGWSPGLDSGSATGMALDLEINPHAAVVPVLRVDGWSYDIHCVVIGPCPNNLTLVSGGVKYRFASCHRPDRHRTRRRLDPHVRGVEHLPAHAGQQPAHRLRRTAHPTVAAREHCRATLSAALRIRL